MSSLKLLPQFKKLDQKFVFFMKFVSVFLNLLFLSVLLVAQTKLINDSLPPICKTNLEKWTNLSTQEELLQA